VEEVSLQENHGVDERGKQSRIEQEIETAESRRDHLVPRFFFPFLDVQEPGLDDQEQDEKEQEEFDRNQVVPDDVLGPFLMMAQPKKGRMTLRSGILLLGRDRDSDGFFGLTSFDRWQ